MRWIDAARLGDLISQLILAVIDEERCRSALAAAKERRLTIGNRLRNGVPGKTVTPPEMAEPEKNQAAVALGRLGGLKGGKARAESLSKKKRAEIAKLAAKTRWARKKDTAWHQARRSGSA